MRNDNNNLRVNLPLIQTKTKFSTTQRSLNYRIVEEWNKCEKTTRSSGSLEIFKSKLKQHLLEMAEQ
jgi:hypothetical protein